MAILERIPDIFREGIIFTKKISWQKLPGRGKKFCFPLGICKLEWLTQGLCTNGKMTKLRGACIYHDNGILGACEYKETAERRVRILKKAGFNAIRSAHNPISEELLDACDKLCGRCLRTTSLLECMLSQEHLTNWPSRPVDSPSL